MKFLSSDFKRSVVGARLFSAPLYSGLTVPWQLAKLRRVVRKLDLGTIMWCGINGKNEDIKIFILTIAHWLKDIWTVTEDRGTCKTSVKKVNFKGL